MSLRIKRKSQIDYSSLVRSGRFISIETYAQI
jgi:hypothetical protein